jgi:hypothetical protein
MSYNQKEQEHTELPHMICNIANDLRSSCGDCWNVKQYELSDVLFYRSYLKNTIITEREEEYNE